MELKSKTNYLKFLKMNTNLKNRFFRKFSIDYLGIKHWDFDAEFEYIRDNEFPASKAKNSDYVSDWYRSLDNDRPAYEMYVDEYYYYFSWLCYLIVSEPVLDKIDRLKRRGNLFDGNKEITSIVDVGCGIGGTTLELAKMWPNANVTGTNLDNVLQNRFVKAIDYPERVKFDYSSFMPQADMYVVLEYFEHFEKPLEELRRILSFRPDWLVVTTAFCDPSVGHFREYDFDGIKIKGKKECDREFYSRIIEAGYGRTFKFWNNTPMLFRNKRTTNKPPLKMGNCHQYLKWRSRVKEQRLVWGDDDYSQEYQEWLDGFPGGVLPWPYTPGD